jgi:ABC-type phosphate transport system substrate-binding protein
MTATASAARSAVAAATVALLLTMGARRAAATECASLPSPIYVAGSTAAKPFLAEIGKFMAGQTPPVTIIYLGEGSCAGVDAILSGTPLLGAGAAALKYWDATGLEVSCDITGSSVLAHIGISDVFAQTCFPLPGGLPTSVADVLGPVQAMTFVAHKASVEKAISAEAAYNVFGFGAQSGVAPWTDDTLIIRRDALSGTQRMIASAIGVPAERWKGIESSSSGDLLTRLGAAAIPDRSIGILSADVAQDNRATVKVLGYQHFGQSCALFPDSRETSNDKANVRSGRYPIWGPLHVLIRLNGSGYPANARAGEVAGYLAGTRPTPAALDLIRVGALRHVVPQCAMRVERSQETGAVTPFAPSGACGCYYEKVATGATTCKPCATAAECPTAAPVCSYGYCEAQ